MAPWINWIVNLSLYILLYYAQQENSDVATFFKKYESTSWYSNKLRDSIVVGGVLFLSSFFHFITRYYGRPILLSVTQLNASTVNGFTLYQYGETQQRNRTINLILSIKRKDTLNWLLSWYLRKYNVYILVKCNYPNIELQAVDEALKPQEIIPLEDGTGFYIDITYYLKSIAIHSQCAQPKMTIPYFIKETRTSMSVRHITGDEITYVNPVLKVNNFLDAPWLLRKVIGWLSDQHEIQYYNGGRI